jgi:hypothetical protein
LKDGVEMGVLGDKERKRGDGEEERETREEKRGGREKVSE